MTTADRAVAEAFRVRNLIYRQPAGWRTPVTVQEWAPNAPFYSWANAGAVDHCGLSLNSILHNIGLVMGRDFGNMAWTPSGYAWMVQQGRSIDLGSVQPGDCLYFSNSGSIKAITHVGMATGRFSGGSVPTIEFNTDSTGVGIEYMRTPGYLVAAGRPIWQEAPVVPPSLVIPPPARRAPVLAPTLTV